MPSGSKKRKAAKKKKEQAANNINSSTNNNPHGNDDPKSQDERDSDGGEVGSPASQDNHNHQHSFSQGEEEEGKRAPSHVQSHVTEEKSVEEATRDAESTEKSGLDDVDVKIEKEWERKEDLESTHVPIQHVEHDKNSSSSSSSSSDDESQAFEKNSKEEACNLGSEVASYSNEDKTATFMSEEVLKVAENETRGDVDCNSAVEAVTVDGLVKTVLSVPEEVDYATEISANKSVPDVVESGLKENEEKSNGTSRVELEGNEGKNFPSSGTPTAETSNVAETNQESGPHDYSKKQPLVASTPPLVQRTSLFSCCGLFDVFTGSRR